MQSIVRLPEEMKIYYNKKVYSPEFSSVGTILLVDKLIKDGGKLDTSVLDVGCGSGIIGLGIKKKNPFSKVTLCDIEPQAIKVTKLNAKRLGMDVSVLECNMLPKLGEWDIICANLPTFSESDLSEHELHGPKSAYYSGGGPLRLYAQLFDQA